MTARAWPARPSARASAAAGGPSAARLCGRAGEQRGPLQEVVDGQARGEAGAAVGRQHVVRAADVVADHLGRMGAEEDRAGMADALGQRAAASRDQQLDVLGRQAIDQRGRVVQVRHHHDRAEVAPAGARDGLARQLGELALDRRGDRIGERGVIGDQDGLRELVVLGLAEQVGGDPGRVLRADRRPRRSRTGRRSGRCRPGRTPGAWLRRHKRCPARRSCRPRRWSRCRTRALPIAWAPPTR